MAKGGEMRDPPSVARETLGDMENLVPYSGGHGGPRDPHQEEQAKTEGVTWRSCERNEAKRKQEMTRKDASKRQG